IFFFFLSRDSLLLGAVWLWRINGITLLFSSLTCRRISSTKALRRDVERFRRHYYGNGKLKPAAKGSRGAELVEGLEMKEGEYKLVKTRFSAFFDTNLHSLLQGMGITHLVVAGVQTPNCIRQTVFDGVSLDYHSITLLSDATAAATPKIHQDNITDMKNVGVVASKVDEWGHSDA
ncbi:putative inactive nicotinamidase, partial [Cucurbita argyrosperma subsp. argyrosperma]